MPDEENIAEGAAKPKRKPNAASRIRVAAQTFILDAEALQEILDVSYPVLVEKEKEHRAELKDLSNQLKLAPDTPARLTYRDAHKFLGLFARQMRGGFLFRGHLLVALVSRFDVFIAQVARELLSAFPDRLGQRSVKYADAVEFKSVEELKEKFIDEEVDNRMRESHVDQLKFLSSLANVTLGADEPGIFPRFVEVTERRTCQIHSGGNVSPQYRRVCSEHKVKFGVMPQDGKRLNVTVNYFQGARRVLSEMAFKIAQTIVRKTFPASQDLADLHVDMIGIDRLKEHRWNEALMVFDYASNLRAGWTGDESVRRNTAINKAQALVGLGKPDEAMEVINSLDWSASHPRYVMAISLLKREFSEAAKLMPLAGLKEDHYRTWPIFDSFRQTQEFKGAFCTVFGHDFDQSTLGAVSAEIAAIEDTSTALAASDEVITEPKPEESKPLENFEGAKPEATGD